MKTAQDQKLFSPVQIGTLTLSHRVVMAPLTRSRSEQPGDIPGNLMLEYYTQRASEGVLAELPADVAAMSSQYLPFAWAETQFQGKTYALPFDTDAARQTTFNRCFDEVRREERERDRHIDLTHAAFLACGDLMNVGHRPTRSRQVNDARVRLR